MKERLSDAAALHSRREALLAHAGPDNIKKVPIGEKAIYLAYHLMLVVRSPAENDNDGDYIVEPAPVEKTVMIDELLPASPHSPAGQHAVALLPCEHWWVRLPSFLAHRQVSLHQVHPQAPRLVRGNIPICSASWTKGRT